MGAFELSTDLQRIEAFLRAQDWLESGESLREATIAGAGNMNRVVRVRTDGRSFILKQSYPYCAKFPEIPAPIERLATEVAFYEVAARSPILAAHMPRVLAFDATRWVAMIEDLGEGSDLLSLYAGDTLRDDELATLGALARALHGLALAPDESERLMNRAMRELNHEHIFDLPLRAGNGLDLDAVLPGLAAVAADAKRDRRYVEGVAALGRLYLEADGPALLHGDYYPGSFLRTGRGLALIDPEFAFPGPVEFDLSVLVAHLVFAGGEPEDVRRRVVAAYGAPADPALVGGFAAAELMRRTLGVSQLPVKADLDVRRGWVEQSRAWVEAWQAS